MRRLVSGDVSQWPEIHRHNFLLFVTPIAIISLEEILGAVLNARPQAFSFEGANPRHEHEWEVFKNVKLPDGKIIIPGVLDSTTTTSSIPNWWPKASSATPS